MLPPLPLRRVGLPRFRPSNRPIATTSDQQELYHPGRQRRKGKASRNWCWGVVGGLSVVTKLALAVVAPTICRPAGDQTTSRCVVARQLSK